MEQIKCARLLKEEFDEMKKVHEAWVRLDIYESKEDLVNAMARLAAVEVGFEVSKGTEMTGFEIISGLPIEEQQKVDLFSESVSTTHGGAFCYIGDECIVMRQLYRYNGTKFEVYDESI